MTAKAPAPTGVGRVLIIDDEPKLRESLADGMRYENWDVATAGTAAEAWQLIEKQSFDVLVLDWMLPDGNGVEVMRTIRAAGLSVPVLMISARGTRADQEFAREKGVSDFLAKPFSFDDLLTHCSALLGRREAGAGE